MPKPIAYVGKKFEMLTVIAEAGYDITKGGRKRKRYLCQCDCGKIKSIRSEHLVNGHIVSCGCKHKRYFGTDATFYQVFKQGKNNNKNNYCCYADGNMTFEQFKSLIAQPCHYCGKPPSNYYLGKSKNPITYSGLDRLDNSRKHDYDNVVPCCKKHNTSKGEFGYAEYINDMILQLKYLGITFEQFRDGYK